LISADDLDSVRQAGTNINNVGGDVQNQKPKTVYVFLRVRIREGSSRRENFKVGRITVMPDDDAVWQNEFSTNRPSWLQMFRDFPDVGSERDGEEARGSIVVTDDDSWIEEHISRLVGVFYFLGLRTNDWRVPSEALSYVGFKLTSSPSNMVELVTKSGRFIERCDSIRFPPPLALRTVGSMFNLSMEKATHQTLCDRFFKNPFDNLAVACFHLYRTQWGDFLHSPHEQDFAAYCACLEAVLDVKDDYPRNVYKSLRSRYDDYPGLDEWVRGLYSERSVFNHGATIPLDPKSADPRMQAWIKFRERRGNWWVIRELCRDVIHRTLEPYKNSIERKFLSGINPADRYLRQLLLSKEAWSEVASRFTVKGAIDKLKAITEDDKDSWIELALEFEASHDWRFVPRPINEHRLICVLRTATAGIGMRAQSRGDLAADAIWSALYTAATSGKGEDIRDWFFERKRNGDGQGVPQTVDRAVLAIAVQVAQYFEN